MTQTLLQARPAAAALVFAAAPVQKAAAQVATALLALLLASTSTWAQDRAEIDKTRITGNRELPKVLYIVPWKKPLPGELASRPLVSVLDQALAPLDRDVVRREQQYNALVHNPASTATKP